MIKKKMSEIKPRTTFDYWAYKFVLNYQNYLLNNSLWVLLH